jgi:hypothetical protein
MATTSTTQKQTRPRESTSVTSMTNQPPTPDAGADSSESASASYGSDANPSHAGIGDELRQLVRDKASEQVGVQKERAAGTLGAVAGAVRSATQGLRDSGQPALASYVTRAADEIDRWTSKLREQDLDDAVREVQAFARRQPAIFLGVAFGAGVLAARFFKSSAPTTPAGRAPTPWAPSQTYAERPAVAHDTSTVGPVTSARREGL